MTSEEYFSALVEDVVEDKLELARVSRVHAPSEFERQQRKIRRVQRHDLVAQAKVDGCRLCGESEPACLDFHHVDPRTKLFSIADALTVSPESLQAEIEKCVVLCANCHRKLHAGLVSILATETAVGVLARMGPHPGQ